MAEETTSTVKKTSDGTVKLTIETYQDLLDRAAEKAPVVHNTIHKTPKMVADDNTMAGGIMLACGVALTVVGGFVHMIGRRQKKALKK